MSSLMRFTLALAILSAMLIQLQVNSLEKRVEMLEATVGYK